MDYDSRQRLRAVLIARQMLKGERHLLEGVRQLLPFHDYIGKGETPTFTRLSAVDSETDDLPIGAERAHWNAQALQEKDVEISRCVELYRDIILQSCREIIAIVAADHSRSPAGHVLDTPANRRAIESAAASDKNLVYCRDTDQESDIEYFEKILDDGAIAWAKVRVFLDDGVPKREIVNGGIYPPLTMAAIDPTYSLTVKLEPREERDPVTIQQAYEATRSLVWELSRELASEALAIAALDMEMVNADRSSDPGCYGEFRRDWGLDPTLSVEQALRRAIHFLASSEFTTRADIPAAFSTSVLDAVTSPSTAALASRWRQTLNRAGSG